MRPFASLLCLSLIGSSFRAADPGPKADEDAKQLIGIWQVVAVGTQGTAAGGSPDNELRIEVSKDKLTLFDSSEKKNNKTILSRCYAVASWIQG